jgi:hypothetical protein
VNVTVISIIVVMVSTNMLCCAITLIEFILTISMPIVIMLSAILLNVAALVPLPFSHGGRYGSFGGVRVA